MTLSVSGAVIEGLLNNEDFARHTLPFLKEEYFTDNSERVLFTMARDYFDQYDCCPTIDIISVQVEDASLPEGVYKQCRELIGYFDTVPKKTEWLIETTEKFCKDQALYNSIKKAIEIIDGKDAKLNRDSIPALLEEALGVSFDTAVGHDYFGDAGSRFDTYKVVEDRIPFDLELFNKVTRGGLPRKTLNILLASIGAGKSQFMCSYAAACIRKGYNVLYITLEMAEERIAERIDANLLDVPISAIEKMSKDSFINSVAKLQQKTHGKLVIKEYPTGGAHVGHFKTLLNDLRQKKKFKPDIIFVDYINICSSQRFKAGGSANSYTIVKSIAEELRGLAVSENVVVFSATQYTREGMSSSDVEMTDVSESIGLPQTSDLMCALVVTEELEALGQVMVKVLKNRYNDPSYYKRFVVGVDRAKMRFYDVEAEALDDIVDKGKVDLPNKIAKVSELKF